MDRSLRTFGQLTKQVNRDLAPSKAVLDSLLGTGEPEPTLKIVKKMRLHQVANTLCEYFSRKQSAEGLDTEKQVCMGHKSQ